MMRVLLYFFLCLLPGTAAAVTFTGHVNTDFPATACLSDPGGQDILWGNSQVGLQFSGFDLTKLCVLYDESTDALQIGILTRDTATGIDYITGDADRDGDPAKTGAVLAQFPPGKDVADFGPQEFFSLVLDSDFAVNNGFNVLAGSSPANALGDFGVFVPASTKLGDAASTVMYGGAAIGSSGASSVFGAPVGPTTAAPHLEFTITGASSLPGMAAAVDFTDPNATLGLFYTMGSHSDGPIGDDAFPGAVGPRILYGLQTITVAHLKQIDADGDGFIDDIDLDDDNDGVPDLTELGLKDCDLNGDGVLSVSQDANGNGIFDAGEEGEILKCAAISTGGKEFVSKGAFAGGVYPDFDGDGRPDYLDTDSDNDGLADGVEDANHNGVLDPGETDPKNSDTDGDGIRDSLESGPPPPAAAETPGDGTTTTPPSTTPIPPPSSSTETNQPEPPPSAEGETDPSAATLDPDLAGFRINQLQNSGSGLTSCALNPRATRTKHPLNWIFLVLPIPFLLLFRSERRTYALTHLSTYALILCYAVSAHALNVQRQRLPTNGSGGIFHDDAATIGRGRWTFGIGTDYTARPFQTTQIVNNQRVDNIADYFVSNDFAFAYGFTDWLDVSLGVQSSVTANVEPFGTTTAATNADFGDLLLTGKLQLLNQVMDDSRFGVAVVPFLTFPTGNTGRYAGDANLTGGFKVVSDHYWGRTQGYANIGVRFREREDFLNMTAAHELLFGVGAQHPIVPNWDLHLMGEIDGSTTFRKFASQEASSPVEVNMGLRKYWMRGKMATTLSSGVGISSGYGAPRVRVAFGVQYAPRMLRDRDEDGIADARDLCPTAPIDATAGGSAKEGCPAEGAPRVIVKVVGDRILILQPINFVTGSAEITQDSIEVVDQVAALLRATPELKKVLVEGHTDNIGGESYNQHLSETRAKSVTDALVARGVEPMRLAVKGWGLTKPLTENTSVAGKAKNRRVEFHILDLEKGPREATRPKP